MQWHKKFLTGLLCFNVLWKKIPWQKYQEWSNMPTGPNRTPCSSLKLEDIIRGNAYICVNKIVKEWQEQYWLTSLIFGSENITYTFKAFLPQASVVVFVNDPVGCGIPHTEDYSGNYWTKELKNGYSPLSGLHILWCVVMELLKNKSTRWQLCKEDKFEINDLKCEVVSPEKAECNCSPLNDSKCTYTLSRALPDIYISNVMLWQTYSPGGVCTLL